MSEEKRRQPVEAEQGQAGRQPAAGQSSGLEQDKAIAQGIMQQEQAEQAAAMLQAQAQAARHAQATAPVQGVGDKEAAMGGEQRPPVPRAARRMTPERVAKAIDTLKKYHAGKANLERQIIESQEWWKLHNWRVIQGEKGIRGSDVNKSSTAWLWNCIVGKHADAMDSYPEPNILPRMQDDQEEAGRLSSIVPVVLETNDFEQVYSDVMWQKMIEGTGAYGVFWDKDKLNGLGDIAIRKVNLLNLYWEPGISDIQDSRNVFHVALMDNDLIESAWPQMRGKTGGQDITVNKYIYDDQVDTSDKSLVIDWYYHTYDAGQKVLHYCKLCGGEVLYSTEDDPELQGAGLYDDGQYPFVLDKLFEEQGTPCSYGYVYVGKKTQKDIDTISQAVVMNAVVSATPRYFVRKDSGVNEEEFTDLSKPLIHVNGNMGQDSLMQVSTIGIQGNVLELYQSKIDELKFITGNTDVSNGNAPSGVTSAAGIAALREQSGRSSKDSTMASYRCFRRLVLMVIERIRQFYELPRQFRIIGQRGEEEFILYSNERLRAQSQGQDFGVDMGYRLPVFDVQVRASRMTGYTKAAQNDLALQLYQNGIFNPQMVDQSLLALDMMDFKEKDEVQQKVRKLGGLMEQLGTLYQIAQTLAIKCGDEGTAQQLAQMAQMSGIIQSHGMQAPRSDGLQTKATRDEKRTDTILSKAANRSAQATRPD